MPGSNASLARWVLAVATILSAAPAAAIPAFARKYETSCLTCHSVYPRLTPFGEAFRRNGYRFPGVDGDFVKQSTIALGQEANKKTFPRTVWPASLPGSVPLAFGVNGQATWYPSSTASVPRANRGTSLTLDDIISEGHLWAGGAIDDTVTFWAELTFGTDGSLDVEHAQGLFNDLLGPRHAVNLVVGRGFPTLTSFGPHSTYLGDARMTTVPVTGLYGLTGDDAFTLSVGRCFAHDNVERAGMAAAYECGIVARVTGWLEGLGLDHEVTPCPGRCFMAQGRECAYTIRVKGRATVREAEGETERRR